MGRRAVVGSVVVRSYLLIVDGEKRTAAEETDVVRETIYADHR